MARTDQKTRDSRGRYLKVTAINKVKLMCNRIMLKLDAWLKSVDV